MPRLARLYAILDGFPKITVAVSGGVDSLTLAAAAHARLGAERMHAYHAVSPAVPPEATERTRALARERGWRLSVLDAGEFADPAYRANPANRCFFCKTNLYRAIAARTDAPIASGTNRDDLGDWRPGLLAAGAHGVRHPFVEAEIDKRGVRCIAAVLNLGAIAELPSSPCLSSRIETGLAIDPSELRFVHTAERMIAAELAPGTVRCRVRAQGVVVELDEATLGRLDHAQRESWRHRLAALLPPTRNVRPIGFAAYRMGSAFLRPSEAAE